jgi:hypothetical protein
LRYSVLRATTRRDQQKDITVPTKSKKPSKSKKVNVDRKFLMGLANDIYNSKTHKFLRLCNGTLQNGPDPTDSRRPMHCGLGELYFAMTGNQPEADDVSEEDVIDLAVKLSPLNGLREKRDNEARAKLDAAMKTIKKLDLDSDLEDDLVSTLKDKKDEINQIYDEDRDDEEKDFREALDEIPGINDDGCGDDICTTATYRERSKRVAAQIREAASYLPR